MLFCAGVDTMGFVGVSHRLTLLKSEFHRRISLSTKGPYPTTPLQIYLFIIVMSKRLSWFMWLTTGSGLKFQSLTIVLRAD